MRSCQVDIGSSRFWLKMSTMVHMFPSCGPEVMGQGGKAPRSVCTSMRWRSAHGGGSDKLNCLLRCGSETRFAHRAAQRKITYLSSAAVHQRPGVLALLPTWAEVDTESADFGRFRRKLGRIGFCRDGANVGPSRPNSPRRRVDFTHLLRDSSRPRCKPGLLKAVACNKVSGHACPPAPRPGAANLSTAQLQA